jgi:glycosyltransferase involved in cell wall biosynthesis
MKSPRTVVLVVTRLNVGGVSRSVIQSACELKVQGDRCVIVSGELCPGEQDMSYLVRENGLSHIRISTLRRGISHTDILTLWKLFLLFVHLQPDIVHTHMAEAGALGRIAALMHRFVSLDLFRGDKRHCLVVHTFHGHVFAGYFGTVQTKIIIRLERFFAIRLTHKIFVLSEQQLDELSNTFRIGKPSQYRVVPHKFQSEPFQFSSEKRRKFRDSLNCSPDEIVVGYVGRLVTIKNPQLFIEAAKLCLKAGGRRFRFVLVGDGELREHLTNSAGQFLKTITFIRHQQNMSEVYCGLDMLCLTSKNEGVPLVLFEAMAGSCPVIASNVGSVQETLGNAIPGHAACDVRERGLLINSFRPEDFFEAIRYLSSDRHLRDVLSVRAKAFISNSASPTNSRGDYDFGRLRICPEPLFSPSPELAVK